MNIQAKLTTTYLLLALFIVASIGISISVWIESYFKNQLINELSRRADVIQFVLLKDSMQTLETLDKEVKFISGLNNERITLINDSGKVLVDSDVLFPEIRFVKNHLSRPEVQQAQVNNNIGFDIRKSATVNHDFLYMAKKVDRKQLRGTMSVVRYIRVSVPYEDVSNDIAAIRFIIIIVATTVFIVIIAVSIFVSRRISRPLKQIAQEVERIRTGDFDFRIAVQSNDEVGLVSKAINELVDKLKNDIVQLKRLEQVRSQFLGNVSHELRTPIFAAQGYLETLLSGKVADLHTHKTFLEKTQSNLDRLHLLLEDLISISQIESGEMKMSFRIFKVNEFLESVGKEFEGIAMNKNISFEYRLTTSKEDEVYADRDRIQQVLGNLLSNAINYNNPGGKVILASEKISHGIEICVIDTGFGISQEHLPRIFERFYRVDNDRSRTLGGTGLGLAIVKHIIEAHNSKVIVESVVGKGSEFKFVLKSE